MSFFDRFNTPKAIAQYKKNSEIPVFIPMEMLSIKKATTRVGETTQINCSVNGDEIFFYLNPNDHGKLVPSDYEFLMEEIAQKRNPYATSIRTRDGLITMFLPFCKLLESCF